MHDIKFIRENPTAFDAGLRRRGLEPLSSTILELDANWRDATKFVQDSQASKNALAKQIGEAKKRGDAASATELLKQASVRDTLLASVIERESSSKKALDALLETIPNLPALDAPLGKDAEDNVEIRRWGHQKNFSFVPRSHFELGEAFGLMDFESAGRVSGSRFVYLKGALGRLERAIGNFMLDTQTTKNHTDYFGYEEVAPPLLVKDNAAYGTGQLPKFQDDLFKTGVERIDLGEVAREVGQVTTDFLEARYKERMKGLFNKRIHETDGKITWDEIESDPEYRAFSDRAAAELGQVLGIARVEEILRKHRSFETLWLIPTAEVPLTNLVADHIVLEATLPRRYAALTPCFRSEAGAAGKDTRGMIRMHQFNKVELVSITTPEQSAAEHERMTGCAEEILKRLKLPHRTMVLSTGDMGFSSAKTYDIEVWLPGQGAYREISSCSNCGDFQARRMDARYRPAEGKGTRFVHTLNGSGLAVGRTLIAVMENYQQADGSIEVPEVLRPYMGGLETIGPRK